jgi:excisionase family DNA binding protein
MSDTKELFISTQEISEDLNVDPSQVRRWLRDGRLPGEKWGRTWLVSRADYAVFKKDYEKYKPYND